MTDGEALIRSVLATPADDAPRLVYADWLEERGRAGDAEFIRVQIELARLGFDGILHTDEQGHLQHAPSHIGDLTNRQLELWGDGFGRPSLPTGMANWSSYPASTLGTQVRVRRGFVERLTCQTDEFLSVADELFARQPVTHVRLVDRRPGWTGRGPMWIHERTPIGLAGIPDELWQFLSEPAVAARGFATADEAEAALSWACVRYGRARAGLE